MYGGSEYATSFYSIWQLKLNCGIFFSIELTMWYIFISTILKNFFITFVANLIFIVGYYRKNYIFWVGKKSINLYRWLKNHLNFIWQFSCPLNIFKSISTAKLTGVAAERNMIICSTRFQHLDIHKVTWICPDRPKSNQMEHILIDRRHVSSVLDVRTFGGVNVDWDHYLVAAKFRLRVSASRTARCSALRKLDVRELRSQRTAEAFSSQL